MEFKPEIIDVTTLGDSTRRVVSAPYTLTTTSPLTTDSTIYYPPYTTEITAEDLSKGFSWEEMITKLGKEEEAKVNVISKKSVNSHEHIVYCEDKTDLSIEKILTTLSAVKGRLMFEIAPIHIKEIQCKMTPTVKNHIIEASKKLKMYGKKSPIIPSFDEYGNRLPDRIEIGEDKGITVKIVEPEKYGDVYFELKALEFEGWYDTSREWSYGLDDLPF